MSLRAHLLLVLSLNLLLASLIMGAYSIKPVNATVPYLKFVTEYYYCPLLDSNPHGRLNLIVDISKVMYDGSSSYDWYFYSNIPVGSEGIRLQTVPGAVAYGSDWETAASYAKNIVYNAGTYRWLVDYDPTTTDGFTSATATASVTISPTGIGGGLSQSYTYNIPYIKVLDQSDFAEHRAYWVHDFNEQQDPPGSPSDSTYLSRPAFVVKTAQNYPSYVDGWYKVEWGHLAWFWWEYVGFESFTLPYDAFLSGDTEPPSIPSTPSGPTSGVPNTVYTYSTSTTDPDSNDVRYLFDWDDGYTLTDWYPSGATAYASHSWSDGGYKCVKVRAQDSSEAWSDWSPNLGVTIGGGGSCPTLFVWNGSNYESEGLLNIHADSDVTVQHEIQNTLALKNNFYNLQLRELDEFTSHVDQVKLYAVDHQGEWHMCPLIYAKHENSYVTLKLLFDDEKRVDLKPSQTINLNFLPSISHSEIAHFIFEINGYNSKTP